MPWSMHPSLTQGVSFLLEMARLLWLRCSACLAAPTSESRVPRYFTEGFGGWTITPDQHGGDQRPQMVCSGSSSRSIGNERVSVARIEYNGWCEPLTTNLEVISLQDRCLSKGATREFARDMEWLQSVVRYYSVGMVLMIWLRIIVGLDEYHSQWPCNLIWGISDDLHAWYRAGISTRIR